METRRFPVLRNAQDDNRKHPVCRLGLLFAQELNIRGQICLFLNYPFFWEEEGVL